jgi:hypothetical protein
MELGVEQKTKRKIKLNSNVQKLKKKSKLNNSIIQNSELYTQHSALSTQHSKLKTQINVSNSQKAGNGQGDDHPVRPQRPEDCLEGESRAVCDRQGE